MALTDNNGSFSRGLSGGFGDYNTRELHLLYMKLTEMEQLLHSKASDGGDKAAFAELEQKYREMEAKLKGDYDRLAAELDRLTDEKNGSDRLYLLHARRAINRLSSAIKMANRLPAECFFPGQMRLYEAELEKARAFLTDGLYSISAATAGAADLSVRIMRNSIKNKHEELCSMAERYSAQLRKAENFAASEKFRSRIIDNEEVTLQADELGYWSDGVLDMIADEIQQHHRNIGKIRDISWLMTQKEPDVKELLEAGIRQAIQLPYIMQVAAEAAFSAYMGHQRTEQLLQRAIPAMMSQNFALESDVCDPFRGADTRSFREYLSKHLIGLSCSDPVGLPDIREARSLTFVRSYSASPGKDRLVVTIIPTRHETNVRISVRCEYNGLQDGYTIDLFRNIFSSASNCIKTDIVPCGTIHHRDPQRIFTRKEAEAIALRRASV